MSRLAVLSVSDKTGLGEFASALIEEFGFRIISSGGTAKALQDMGLPVTKVSDYTGSPEILGGRVKTLHPRIHGGILARRDVPSDLAELEANDMQPIDLVVVNLYPFGETISRPGVSLAEAIEQIDVGGPAMLRAAAKNFANLTVLCQPGDYSAYLEELRAHGSPSWEFRQRCAQKVFVYTANYDRVIANYLDDQSAPLPSKFHLEGDRLQTLRYGENPHQQAAWYDNSGAGWSGAVKLQGKELSYNNLVDLEAARQLISEFRDRPAAVIIKHTNPCGVALADTLAEAYRKAYQADTVSAFGGIVALNQPIDLATAEELSKIFLECIVAPACEPEALDTLSKKTNLRILTLADLHTDSPVQIKAIAGGFLVQQSDIQITTPQDWQIVTQKQPTPEQLQELWFGWRVVKHVKSNAIVVSNNQATLGVGAGQMNRVGSVKIALDQAGEQAVGAYLASDAFFPFPDSVEIAAEAGIVAIVQPGGSVRDADSIKAANDLGLIMAFTHMRHFSH
jgi:phosphoribosylaminoimidazolecarboxamide formyltransferase/IMP cyclohydrolase